MEILHQPNHRHDLAAISFEQYEKRRAQRRRRVAKRITKRNPIFVVQEMQKEFPGYTWDLYVEDMQRPRRKKKKSMRHFKSFRFDWPFLNKQIPDFVAKCTKRTPTTATLRLRKENGDSYKITIRAMYDEPGNPQRIIKLTTIELIHMWRFSTKKEMLSHPSILIDKEDNTMPP